MTKLTLSVDKEVIEKAKAFARKQGRSLSSLVEDYLKSLTTPDDQPEKLFDYSPIVQSLRGSVKLEGDSRDYREILEDELLKKYLNK
jgi:hypothetical protein